jgi:hypothetical protein
LFVRSLSSFSCISPSSTTMTKGTSMF